MQDNGSFDFIALEMNAHSVGRQAQRLAFATAVSCGRPDIAQNFSEETFQNAYDETVWNFDDGVEASVPDLIDRAIMDATEHLVVPDLELCWLSLKWRRGAFR